MKKPLVEKKNAAVEVQFWDFDSGTGQPSEKKEIKDDRRGTQRFSR